MYVYMYDSSSGMTAVHLPVVPVASGAGPSLHSGSSLFGSVATLTSTHMTKENTCSMTFHTYCRYTLRSDLAETRCVLYTYM